MMSKPFRRSVAIGFLSSSLVFLIALTYWSIFNSVHAQTLPVVSDRVTHIEESLRAMNLENRLTRVETVMSSVYAIVTGLVFPVVIIAIETLIRWIAALTKNARS